MTARRYSGILGFLGWLLEDAAVEPAYLGLPLSFAQNGRMAPRRLRVAPGIDYPVGSLLRNPHSR